MIRRVCLLLVSNDVLSTFLAALPSVMPPGVSLSGQQEVFDRAVTILRFEGPGLPDWCEEPPHGGAYAIAMAHIGQARLTFLRRNDPTTQSQAPPSPPERYGSHLN